MEFESGLARRTVEGGEHVYHLHYFAPDVTALA